MSEQNIEDQLKRQQSQLLDVAKAVSGHHVLFGKIDNITDNLTTIVKLQQQRLDKLSARVEDAQNKTRRVSHHVRLYFAVMVIISIICFYVAVVW